MDALKESYEHLLVVLRGFPWYALWIIYVYNFGIAFTSLMMRKLLYMLDKVPRRPSIFISLYFDNNNFVKQADECTCF
ncbi:unnamed protein product [Rotaria sordida]|uniref:Uncharacterized protein n=1 Tax=Rotaria sordida TaxID=392033 RepID=A0A816DAH6_9BILA|nr:unnamed protein product [Rotaria sordida]CAF1634788.1 unnamed protein product [Rotaria sordida]